MTNKQFCYYFTEITHSSLGHINVRLCRSHCFVTCIEEVVKAQNNYGTWPSTGELVYLFTHDLSDCEVTNKQCELAEHYCTEFYQILNHSVTRARGVLFASLLCNLLTAAGVAVTICRASDSHSNNDTLFNSLLLCSPTISPYICNQSADTSCLDVKKYLSEKNLVGTKLLIFSLSICSSHLWY